MLGPRAGCPKRFSGLGSLVGVALGLALTRPIAADEATLRRPPDQSRSTIVLVRDSSPSLFLKEAITRLEGELRASGFVVVLVTKATADPRRSLESAVASSGAVAGIFIERDEDRAKAEVWVSDTLTGKLSVRPLESGESPGILAVRAVELLRASLLELDLSSAPIVPGGPIEKMTGRSLASLRSSAGVEAAFVMALHPELVEAAFAPALRAFVSADNGLGGRVSVIAPMLGTSIVGELGVAELSTEVFLAEFIYAPPLSPWFGVTAVLGVGGLHLEARGELDDPSRARSEDLGGFVVAPGFGIVARLADHFALTSEVSSVFLIPPLRIDMGDERLGVVGRPMLLASHGLLVTF